MIQSVMQDISSTLFVHLDTTDTSASFCGYGGSISAVTNVHNWFLSSRHTFTPSPPTWSPWAELFCTWWRASWGEVILTVSPLGTSASNWSIVPAPDDNDDDDNECGAVGGMKIGRESRNARRKPVPVSPLCPPQIPHDLTWARTRAAAVGSRRLNAWPMARPWSPTYLLLCFNIL
jgi:hypothetical protein